jgi:hypothetical protein
LIIEVEGPLLRMELRAKKIEPHILQILESIISFLPADYTSSVKINQGYE